MDKIIIDDVYYIINKLVFLLKYVQKIILHLNYKS